MDASMQARVLVDVSMVNHRKQAYNWWELWMPLCGPIQWTQYRQIDRTLQPDSIERKDGLNGPRGIFGYSKFTFSLGISSVPFATVATVWIHLSRKCQKSFQSWAVRSAAFRPVTCGNGSLLSRKVWPYNESDQWKWKTAWNTTSPYLIQGLDPSIQCFNCQSKSG